MPGVKNSIQRGIPLVLKFSRFPFSYCLVLLGYLAGTLPGTKPLGAEEFHTNLVVDIPVELMPRTTSTQVVRSTKCEDRTTVRTEGSGTVSVSTSLQDCRGGVQLRIGLDGSGIGKVFVHRNRMHIVADANSQFSGGQTVLFTDEAVQLGNPEVAVVTEICPRQVTFDAVLPLVRQFGARIGQNVFNDRIPEFEARASKETEERLKSELASRLSEATREKVAVAKDKLQALQEKFGVTIAVSGSQAGHVGRVHFQVAPQPTTAGVSASAFAEGVTLPAVTTDGRLAIHVSDGCLSHLAGILSNRTISETEFGEIVFGQVGFRTEYSYDSNVPRVPKEITFASTEPITFQIDKDHVVITLRLSSFTDDNGNRVDVDAQVVGRYAVTMRGESTEINQVGDVEITTSQAEKSERIQILADHFLPTRGEFTGLNLFSLLLSDAESSPSVLRLSQGWLTIATQVTVDPKIFTKDDSP